MNEVNHSVVNTEFVPQAEIGCKVYGWLWSLSTIPRTLKSSLSCNSTKRKASYFEVVDHDNMPLTPTNLFGRHLFSCCPSVSRDPLFEDNHFSYIVIMHARCWGDLNIKAAIQSLYRGIARFPRRPAPSARPSEQRLLRLQVAQTHWIVQDGWRWSTYDGSRRSDSSEGCSSKHQQHWPSCTWNGDIDRPYVFTTIRQFCKWCETEHLTQGTIAIVSIFSLYLRVTRMILW